MEATELSNGSAEGLKATARGVKSKAGSDDEWKNRAEGDVD